MGVIFRLDSNAFICHSEFYRAVTQLKGYYDLSDLLRLFHSLDGV